VFDTGLALSKDRNFLGYRPKLSANPVKYAGHYIWQTYAEVDVRRRAVGSALTSLFQQGVLGGGEMETVGLWSQNRPGELQHRLQLKHWTNFFRFPQNGRYSTLLAKVTRRWSSVFMIPLERILLVRFLVICNSTNTDVFLEYM
jgi:hypothetical protein